MSRQPPVDAGRGAPAETASGLACGRAPTRAGRGSPAEPGDTARRRPTESGHQDVTSIAVYVPENREIDLSMLSPADYEMVKGLHGLIHRGDSVLLCKRARGDREMHVAKSSHGRYFARHFSGGGHGDHSISRITDEHLRGTDCWVRAWSDIGLSTGTEVRTDNHVQLDAMVFGSNIVGLETQVQPQSAPVVKGRHTRRRNARSLTGKYARQLSKPLDVVWFAPVGRPDWLYQVPTIQCQNRSWEATPDPHTVPAIGVRSIDVKPCSSTWFQRCPDRRFGWCGKVHLWAQPRNGLSIADVAAMVPEGDLTPVKLDNGIYLTDRVGYARCHSFGYSAPADNQPPQAPQPKAKGCEWDGHKRPSSAEPPRPLRALNLGKWVLCIKCGRRHRPANIMGLCHYCRTGGS